MCPEAFGEENILQSLALNPDSIRWSDENILNTSFIALPVNFTMQQSLL